MSPRRKVEKKSRTIVSIDHWQLRAEQLSFRCSKIEETFVFRHDFLSSFLSLFLLYPAFLFSSIHGDLSLQSKRVKKRKKRKRMEKFDRPLSERKEARKWRWEEQFHVIGNPILSWKNADLPPNTDFKFERSIPYRGKVFANLPRTRGRTRLPPHAVAINFVIGNVQKLSNNFQTVLLPVLLGAINSPRIIIQSAANVICTYILAPGKTVRTSPWKLSELYHALSRWLKLLLFQMTG